MKTTSAVVMALLVAGTLAAGCDQQQTSSGPESPEPGALGTQGAALTAAQCDFMHNPGDKVVLCHRTSSGSNPYVVITTDYNGCVSGHANHALDYIASKDPTSPLYDPTCKGLGCYPEGMPFDGTVECCEGLAVNARGVCEKVPEPFTCKAAPTAVFEQVYVPAVSIAVDGVPTQVPYMLPKGAKLVSSCCLADCCGGK